MVWGRPTMSTISNYPRSNTRKGPIFLLLLPHRLLSLCYLFFSRSINLRFGAVQMGEGRGSAIAVAALLGFLLLHSQVVDAAIYAVGGKGGWTFGVNSWTKGKRFRAGDTLVFNYNSRAHNVIPVNKARHDSCTMPRGAKVFRSGKDRIKLVKGPNFFICGVQGHCQSGLKISIVAM